MSPAAALTASNSQRDGSFTAIKTRGCKKARFLHPRFLFFPPLRRCRCKAPCRRTAPIQNTLPRSLRGEGRHQPRFCPSAEQFVTRRAVCLPFPRLSVCRSSHVSWPAAVSESVYLQSLRSACLPVTAVCSSARPRGRAFASRIPHPP